MDISDIMTTPVSAFNYMMKEIGYEPHPVDTPYIKLVQGDIMDMDYETGYRAALYLAALARLTVVSLIENPPSIASSAIIIPCFKISFFLLPVLLMPTVSTIWLQ